MGSSQQFSLRWNNYLKHITSAFETLRTDEDLVDVTLSCEGKRIRAHKMLLSACSTYFRDLFKENPCQHPVIIFRNVKFDDLAALVDFIYQGEVNVVQEQLDSFMTTAELLAVQGLTDGSRKDDSLAEDDEVEIPSEPEVQLRGVPGKVITNDRGTKTLYSSSPYHTNSYKSDTPPNKRRRVRENSNTHSEKSNRHNSPKDSEQKSDAQPAADPVEIIPLLPNLKTEMPEYLEQDGSSCSYDEQNEGSNKLLVDSQDIMENDHKPEISQTFYTNQSTDNLDASKSSDIGYLLSKPGTSSADRESVGENFLLESVFVNEIKTELEEREEQPRKKVKNPDSWKVNITKKACNEGKAYISSSTKKLMPAKAMKESCGQNCRFKCENKVSEEARALFFSKYYSLDCKSKKYYFILQHVTEKKLSLPVGLSDETGKSKTPKKNFTRTYTIPVNDRYVPVCKTMFLNTLSISEKVARTIFQKIRSGESLLDNRGRFKKRKSEQLKKN